MKACLERREEAILLNASTQVTDQISLHMSFNAE